MNETCVAKYGMIFSTCVAAGGFPRTSAPGPEFFIISVVSSHKTTFLCH